MRVAAVLFDLDGTLTEPFLDFDAIRAEMGQVQGPILEAMNQMDSVRRQQCEEILARHEIHAAEQATLNPGAMETLAQLKKESRGIGVLTRNTADSVRRILAKHPLPVDAIVTREDGPAKPDPFGVLHLCERLKVSPQQCLMVGDYVFDLQTAQNAGAKAVLISTNSRYQEFAHHADYVIHSLPELLGVIQSLEDGCLSP